MLTFAKFAGAFACMALVLSLLLEPVTGEGTTFNWIGERAVEVAEFVAR